VWYQNVPKNVLFQIKDVPKKKIGMNYLICIKQNGRRIGADKAVENLKTAYLSLYWRYLRALKVQTGDFWYEEFKNTLCFNLQVHFTQVIAITSEK
jgi:hypothetical protein